jgi:16S rRNA (cytidine1402-2'-O)-methyltransferase
MAYFYVIGTPIGNLEDITLRALRILKEVDVILCEDTRVTSRLLEKYAINTRTQSYHSQSTIGKEDLIIDMIKEGKNIALVSDAGTPAISDPGSKLISIIRERCTPEEVTVVAIPGPSALISALSIAGVPVAEFTFLGFLPHKKGRETLFKEIAASERTMVFYESPHRILKTLESLEKHLEGVTAKVVVARELTKIFEEIVSGTPAEMLAYYKEHEDKVRGEFVVIVGK